MCEGINQYRNCGNICTSCISNFLDKANAILKPFLEAKTNKLHLKEKKSKIYCYYKFSIPGTNKVYW